MAGIRYKDMIFSGAAAFGDADHVAYDNTESGLSATDVQGAVDEVCLNMNSHKLGDSGTITLASKFGGTVYYRKVNGIVTVYLSNTQLTGMTANVDNLIGTLPTGYRPLAAQAQLIHLYGDNGYCMIGGNGTVVIHPTATSQYVAFAQTYIASD